VYRVGARLAAIAGVACLRDRRFDAVLLDLNLPDSMGLSTVEQVHACNPNVPVVVLTGEDADELALQAVQAGAEDYICKSEWNPSSCCVRSAMRSSVLDGAKRMRNSGSRNSATVRFLKNHRMASCFSIL